MTWGSFHSRFERPIVFLLALTPASNCDKYLYCFVLFPGSVWNINLIIILLINRNHNVDLLTKNHVNCRIFEAEDLFYKHFFRIGIYLGYWYFIHCFYLFVAGRLLAVSFIVYYYYYSLYQVWTLWDHSFLSYAADISVNRKVKMAIGRRNKKWTSYHTTGKDSDYKRYKECRNLVVKELRKAFERKLASYVKSNPVILQICSF